MKRDSRFALAASILLLVLLPIAAIVTDFALTNVRKLFQRQPRLRIASPVYHHDLARNFSGEDTWGPARYPFFTDSFGFRDERVRDVPLRVPHHRLLLLGDSFTEGMGVAWPQTFAGILAAQGADVLNAGVSSYAPINYYTKAKYLLEAGLRFDEVVVFLDLSDILDGIFYRLDEHQHVEFAIPWRNHPWHRLIARDTLSRILAWNTTLLYPLWDGWYCRRHRDECRYATWADHGNWTHDERLFAEFGKEGLEIAGHYMDRLAGLLRENRIPLRLVIYPWPAQVERGDRENPHVIFWRAWAARNAVPLLDLFPVFIGREPGRQTLERLFIPSDVHWNADGHALVAQELGRFLKRVD